MNKNTDIFDKDLNPILEISASEELDYLVEYQKKKMSESLTNSEPYKKHAPDHTKYADLIANELRDFGGNTLVNVFRGEGPSWYEITCDVADKLNAPYKKGQEIEMIEDSILSTILEKAWEKMTEEERTELLDSMGISNKAAIKGAAIGIFQAIFRAGGFKSFQLTAIVATQIAKAILGKGLPFVVMGPMMKWAAILTGPIGWALTSIWTLVDIAGPSYKVTIPSVVHVSLLRKKRNSTFCKSCEAVLPDNSFKFCPECGGNLD